MAESNKEIVLHFLEEHITQLSGSGGGGSSFTHPNFDLTARDFIDFAEKDLEEPNSIHSLVNATSNLKRAVDCQLDAFLLLLNIDDFYRKKRLGVNRKLGFLEKSGIFRSKSLEKLNRIRNRLEHHYETPDINDVEVYYDLVVAFVSVIESVMPLVGLSSLIELEVGSEGFISTEYKRETPLIEISITHKPTNFEKVLSCNLSSQSSNVEDLEEFAFFFKIHYAFWLFNEGISNNEYILKFLKK